MANFRAYSGLFVRVTVPFKNLKVGDKIQIMGIRFGRISFVNVPGQFTTTFLAQHAEPVYE